MNDQTQIFSWAIDELNSQGYEVRGEPEVLFKTPWSTVMRVSTDMGNVYLKHTPPALSLEPEIIQILSSLCHAQVPDVIAINDDIHCFLMRDAGITIRENLKSDFNEALLVKPISQFCACQQSSRDHLDVLIRLGVPDWRLNHLPRLYDQMITRKDFLKLEGMSDVELQRLEELRPRFLEQCNQLSRYAIPDTIVQPDFNTNNVLMDLNTQALTFIDLGEIVISHPFFSLLNYLSQATIHHGMNEKDPLYQKMLDACIEPWVGKVSQREVESAFMLARQLEPIYAVLSLYRLMMAVDPQALKTYYAHRPNKLTGHLRAYLSREGD